ncbi:hypothetical protein CR513_63030, partial [Mucuna pruriens]
MGIRFLIWLLFVSCIQVISSSDSNRNLSSDQTVANASHSKSNIEKYGITKEALKVDTKVEVKDDLSRGSKTQRGKAANGGADVNRRPTHNSAASSLPCYSTISVGLALILAFSFNLN